MLCAGIPYVNGGVQFSIIYILRVYRGRPTYDIIVTIGSRKSPYRGGGGVSGRLPRYYRQIIRNSDYFSNNGRRPRRNCVKAPSNLNIRFCPYTDYILWVCVCVCIPNNNQW